MPRTAKAYAAWNGFVLVGKPIGTPKPAERTLDTRIGGDNRPRILICGFANRSMWRGCESRFIIFQPGFLSFKPADQNVFRSARLIGCDRKTDAVSEKPGRVILLRRTQNQNGN